MNIYEKLLNITNEIKNVSKNLEVGIGKNSYKAVGEADVLKAVKELEFKYKIYSYPSKREIVDRDILQTKKEYNGQVTEGNQIFLRIETTYKFVNVEKPEETIEVITYGDGVDTQDKAPGKAMTYADKYALLKAYKIISGDDPDQEKSPDNVNYTKKPATKTNILESVLNSGKHVGKKWIEVCQEDISYVDFLITKGNATASKVKKEYEIRFPNAPKQIEVSEEDCDMLNNPSSAFYQGGDR